MPALNCALDQAGWQGYLNFFPRIPPRQGARKVVSREELASAQPRNLIQNKDFHLIARQDGGEEEESVMHSPLIISAVLAALVIAGCQTSPAPTSAAQTSAASAAPESEEMRQARGFAQAACGGCHAVERYGLSADPDAPEWPTIVNRPGLTAETLRAYLLDAHNYPEQMDFYLDDDEVDQLVAYMLTLQEANYRLPPS